MLPLECENHRCISAHLQAMLSGHETALDIYQSVSIVTNVMHNTREYLNRA